MPTPKKTISEVTDWSYFFAHEKDTSAEITVPKLGRRHYEWPVTHKKQADSGAHMNFSSFCTVRFLDATYYYEVMPWNSTIDLVMRHTVFIADDTMNFEVIEWPGLATRPSGQALFQCKHSRILGGVWVAKLDVSTIPRPGHQRELPDIEPLGHQLPLPTTKE
jgi:hypothetical protein